MLFYFYYKFFNSSLLKIYNLLEDKLGGNMIFIGNISKFDKIVQDNLQLGLREDKIVPCFTYQGNYNLKVGKGIVEKSGLLREIIEEVCYFDNEELNINQQYLITREIGQSRQGRPPNSRISLIEAYKNEIYIWRPLLSEIFEGLKIHYEVSGRHFLTIFKEISDSLGINQDFKVLDLVNKHYNKELKKISLGFQIQVNEEFSIGIEAFFSLIKHIMITEDMTYNQDGQMGRYLMQLAIYDYIVHDMELEHVLSKYRLRN